MTQTSATDIEGGDVIPPTRVTSTTPPPAPSPGRNDNFFTTDQLEAARREERDKLNKDKKRLKEQNQQMESELAELRQFKDQLTAERQAVADAEAAAARAAEEEEMSSKELVARRAQELEDKLAARDRELAQKFAMLELERKAVQLQGYISTRVAQETAAKSIAPQFVDYIDGTSEAEVEASIEKAKAKTAEIAADLAGQGQGQPHGVSLRTGPSDFGTVTETRDDGVDYENMSFGEYMKLRPKLGMTSGGGQGIFQ